MDAKIGDWVVTPRIGKPVEINALWFNALCSMAHLAELLKLPSKPYRDLALRASRRVSSASSTPRATDCST